MSYVQSSSSLAKRCSKQRERLHATGLSICSSACLSPKCKKTRVSQKLSNLELRCPLTTYRKSHMGFSTNLLLTPKIQDCGDPPSWMLPPKCKNAIFWKTKQFSKLYISKSICIRRLKARVTRRRSLVLDKQKRFQLSSELAETVRRPQ